MFALVLAGLSCDGWQPPAIGRGCGLDLLIRVAGFLVPGNPPLEAGRAGFHGPGTWRLSRAGPGFAGNSASPRPPVSVCASPERSAAAKTAFGRRRAAGSMPELPDG